MLVLAAAAVVAILLLRGNDTLTAVSTTTTAQIVSSSTTTTVLSTTTTHSTTTTTTAVASAPGDSPGKWVEIPVPNVPATVQYASLSDSALLLETGGETSSKIYAYMLGSSSLIELPVKSPQAGATDIDGDLAVWWEGTYDDSNGSYADQHIYAYRLPDGPEVEVAGADRNPSYPQIAGSRVTWVQSTPLESDPEEFSRMPIYGVRVNADGSPDGEPDELVPSAIASVVGDSGWTYSLTQSYLVWEQAQADSGFDAGSHVLTFGDAQTLSLGGDAWRPSASGNVVVYASQGLKAVDLASQRVWNVDAGGDFPSTAPTFVGYFRSIQNGDATAYEVVARGLDSGKEQVLGQVSNPPWLWAPVVTSADHVAYISDDGKPHLFEWQAGE